MGLITKEVEMLLTNNVKHYEDLGYEIPRAKRGSKFLVPRGTRITVKTEDLSKGSHYSVKVECDCCKKIYEQPYQSYCDYNRDGKIYCWNCTERLFASGENHCRWNANITEEERITGRCYPEYTNFINCMCYHTLFHIARLFFKWQRPCLWRRHAS